MLDLNITEGFALPTTAEKVKRLMKARDGLYDVDVTSDRYYRYFEVLFNTLIINYEMSLLLL